MSVMSRDRDVESDGKEPARGEIVAAERFAARSGAALLGTVAAGLGFGALAALVRSRWQPMQDADQAVIDRVNAVVTERPLLRDILLAVTDLGATPTLLLVLAVAALWLLLRGQLRLAVFVALAGAGGLVLNPVVKELVERLRPEVESPVYVTDGWSFPSGHAMSSLICYGVVLLVFAPVLRPVPRRVVATAGVLLIAAIGLTRIGLGVHYPSDVVAGWLLGGLWLVAVTVAFDRWRDDSGIRGTGPLPGDVAPGDEDDLRPVPRRHVPTMPHPWRGLGELAVAWVLTAGLLVGLGLVARMTGNPVARWDHAVVAGLVDDRTEGVTSVLAVFGEIGNTIAIIVAAVVVAVLAVAVLRSRRPLLFLAVALLGEITLFLATAAIVDRPRPAVAHLNPDLPPTASFPSGHVAASLTLYAGTAALIWASTDRRILRILAGALLLIPVLVAAQRLYAGAHHPTDVLGSLLLAAVWVSVAWWVVRPVPAGTRRRNSRAAEPDRSKPAIRTPR